MERVEPPVETREKPARERPANPRRPIVALFAIGVALITALSFVPYTILPFQQAGQPLAVVLPPGARNESHASAKATAFAPVAPVAPSFDAAAWYASRGEEPEKHGVLIASLDGQRVYASHNANTPFNPASLVKLATTLVALRRLGVNHRFETRVYADGQVDHAGTLRGRLYIASEDPTFGDAAAALIARELRARGIKSVGDGIFVSPNFSFNFSESPDDSARYAARVMNLGQLKEEKNRKGAGGEKNARSAESARERERREAKAEAQKKERTRQAVAEVDEELAENERSEKNRLEEKASENKFVADPPPTQPLFVLHSHPLRDVLLYMNAHSSNFIATRIGALVGGAPGVQSFLINEIGIPSEQVTLSTTSGLDFNRMTPVALHAVIRALHEETQRQGLKLEDVMPIVSSDYGTLRHRLRETALAGAAVGKTGTLAHDDGGMASIAGVVFTQNAGMILFALLDQGHMVWQNRQFEEQLLAEVITTQAQPAPLPLETPRRLLPQTNLQIEQK